MDLMKWEFKLQYSAVQCSKQSLGSIVKNCFEMTGITVEILLYSNLYRAHGRRRVSVLKPAMHYIYVIYVMNIFVTAGSAVQGERRGGVGSGASERRAAHNFHLSITL